MTDVVLIGLFGLGAAAIAATPPTIAAVAGARKVADKLDEQNVQASKTTEIVVESAKEATAVAASAAAATKEVHELVNARLSAETKRADDATAEMRRLTGMNKQLLDIMTAKGIKAPNGA